MLCWDDTCMNNAEKRCTGCKTAIYCSEACQKKHWSSHKKECKFNRAIYDMKLKEEEEEKKNGGPAKPRKTHCTGCNEKFKADWVEVDQECPDCGYITCESCSCSNSRGSCYCQESNFGRYRYCTAEPKSYHRGRRGHYAGNYHPSKEDGYELNREDYPEAFTEEPRPCNSCGKVTYILKKRVYILLLKRKRNYAACSGRGPMEGAGAGKAISLDVTLYANHNILVIDSTLRT